MMIEFVRLIIDREKNKYINIRYLPEIMFLYLRYSKFLDDDYAKDGQSFYEYFISLLERLSPFFWVILYDGKVSGFVFLDNIIGDRTKLHSAEITTCFKHNFWGDYTKFCASLFINYCFKKLCLKKLKALIYPQNFRVKTLLKFAGFKREGYLKCETVKNTKMQDIEIYSVINEER